TGVCLGTTMGEAKIFEVLNEAWINDTLDDAKSSLIPRVPPNVIPGHIAAELGLRGPNYIIPTACAAGNYAIGYAYDLIKSGDTDMMFAGGADAFSRIAFCGFNRLLSAAPQSCQPFDRDRKGMLVGEGAGILILESLESAEQRKASIYGEIIGYGLSCDATHMTTPSYEGIKNAMLNALSQAHISASQVDYLSAHGTGTAANDREECRAIKEVFGQDYKRVAVSSIKSMLGHAMGAASALEAIACCCAVKNDIIPPTINFKVPDPECDIDCVPNIARKKKVSIALNNAFAFGGNNSCLVLKKFLS
ncbi:MAG: beta-ketoacyl-[acyl-carrier-protein] synthase family protein, partial [Candidatus Omnitrophica bacterium]|nr:beta-ketoacyl-[acyl-carrier-protein] synthase family protein [Candidatus Omnitrophota bacterium]